MNHHVCPICGSETKSFAHPKTKVVFHECPICELIVKDSKHYINSDEELKIYDLHQNSLEDEGYVNYLTNFLEQAVIPFAKKGEILDFGSGPSPVLSNILASLGYEVDIYDYFYSPEKVYLSKQYDVITSTEVVEHLRDPLLYFKLFYNHLKSQGYLSIMTLFYPKDKQIFFDWFYIRDQSHVTFYSPKTMAYIAKVCNFKVILCNDYRIAVFQK